MTHPAPQTETDLTPAAFLRIALLTLAARRDGMARAWFTAGNLQGEIFKQEDDCDVA